jgi:hypothetical protein
MEKVIKFLCGVCLDMTISPVYGTLIDNKDICEYMCFCQKCHTEHHITVPKNDGVCTHDQGVRPESTSPGGNV